MTISSVKAQTLHLTVARVGLGQPPSTFTSKVRIGAGQRLGLGPWQRLKANGSTLTARLTGGHRPTRTLRLVNHARRPMLRVAKVVARHGHKTVVAIRLITRGAKGGQVAVTVAVGKRFRTVQVAARGRMTAKVPVGHTSRHGRLRVWAVVVSARGQSSRTMTTTARVS